MTQATHIEGDLINHIYFRNEQHPMEIDVALYSPYYTAKDCDALCVTITNCNNEVLGRF